jgi:hypothetical protein
VKPHEIDAKIKATKKDPLGKYGDICPACLSVQLIKVAPCCGAKDGFVQCGKCGYKELL